MLIGLSGRAQAGKDTVANHLVEYYGFRRIAFADKLKDAYAALFDIPRGQVDELKLDDAAHVHITGTQSKDPLWVRNYSSMTVRQSLQRFGTEMGRDVFGVDFWVDLAFDYNTKYESQIGRIVVSDCRFLNEYKKIKFLKGHNVRIIRPDNNFDAGTHISEDEPDPIHVDEMIENKGDLSFLYDSIGMLMEKLNVSPT